MHCNLYKQADKEAKKARKYILDMIKSFDCEKRVFQHEFDDTVYCSDCNGTMTDRLAAIYVDGEAIFVYDNAEYDLSYDFHEDPDNIVNAYMDIRDIDWLDLCKIADAISLLPGGIFSSKMKPLIAEAWRITKSVTKTIPLDGHFLQLDGDDGLVEAVKINRRGLVDELGEQHSFKELMTDDLLSLADFISSRQP